MKRGFPHMVFGEEKFFFIDSLEWENAILLKYIGADEYGMKMEGIFPAFWCRKHDDYFIGPMIYDDDHIYEVSNVDYEDYLIWLYRV
jgi:hypothetical protein